MPLPKPLKIGLITLLIVVVAILGVFLLLVAYVGWKQRQFTKLEDTRDLPVRIEKMAGTYLASRPRAALVVGVHQRGRDWVGGFGTVDSTAAGRKPDGDTIFEIGSITKVFTGIALADAVNRGVVQLDDPLASLLPAEVQLEGEQTRRITLKQLATHSAGVPRLPANFWEQAKDNEENPYAAYTTAQLFASLAEVKLKRTPGSGYEYSNYGTALLGQALAARQSEPYADLLQKLILDPLAMTDTSPVVPEAKRARLVSGYSPKGEATANWDFDAFAPAGGLRSTANDLLKFIRAALNPGDDALGRALKLSLQVHSEVSLERVGLGWHQLGTIEKLTVWWHNGGTGGYVSYLGIDPEHQTGVIVLANHGDAMAGKYDVDKIGVNLLTLAAKVSLE
jgi:serine-type D-Ala-D-Ala carboxypeptidase/endopeptidase